VDGVSGKELASATWGSTSRMLSDSVDKIWSKIDLAFSEEICKNDAPEVVLSIVYCLYEDLCKNVEEE
jgi:hypothetical protein